MKLLCNRNNECEISFRRWNMSLQDVSPIMGKKQPKPLTVPLIPYYITLESPTFFLQTGEGYHFFADGAFSIWHALFPH